LLERSDALQSLRTALIAEAHKDLGHEHGPHLRKHLAAALGAKTLLRNAPLP
jgi:hypothetical protein